MDFFPVMSQMLSYAWYIVPALIVAVILKSPWFKGVMGEFVVNVSTKLLLHRSKYHLIKNVMLSTEDGSTQIDHIIVSRYGVFVVETKNMTGWIFGGANQKMWIQKIYKHSNSFQNPLHQNYKHVKTLEALLCLNDKQLHSVVVFVGNSKFKTKMPRNVTHGGGYLKYIKSKKTEVLSKAEVTAIMGKIQQGRLTPSFKITREHVRHVKHIVAEKKAITTPNCPKCGSEMVFREVKKGQNAGQQFWGCQNFPRCLGVVNC